MRLLILIGFAFFVQTVTAQTKWREGFTLWHSYDSGTQWHVYAAKAMIRQSPSANGVLIDSLPAGTKLQLTKMVNTYTTARGIHAAWMEIKYNDGTATKSGFVWLGSVGFKHLQKGDTVFIYGIDKVSMKQIEDYTDYSLHVGLKAIQNKNLIDEKKWTIAGDESSSYADAKLLGNMGLQNTHEVLRINFGGEACGVPTKYYYYGWNGQRFFDLPGKYNVGDAGIFYHMETLLFPSEKGGKPGHIIKLIEEETVLEEETDKKPAKYKKTKEKETYVWNGEKATKVK